MADVVLSERRGAAQWITINRPDKRNALNEEVVRAIDGGIAAAMASDDCRAIVLTGAGGNFTAGGDISEMRPRGNPPMPSAKSTEIEPVEIDGTACTGWPPRRITEPFPNCFSIWLNARSTALSFSLS